MQDFTAKNQTQEQLIYIQRSPTHTHTHTPTHTHRHTEIHSLHTSFKKVTRLFVKVRKKMHGRTHCMNTQVMYTHIRAVANVCLSVCLALRRAVRIIVYNIWSCAVQCAAGCTVSLSYQCCEGQHTQTLSGSVRACAVECVHEVK